MIKIPVNKGLSFFTADIQLSRQAETRHSIDNAKVNGFGNPSHLRCDQLRRDKKYLRSSTAVNIFIFPERFQQSGIL